MQPLIRTETLTAPQGPSFCSAPSQAEGISVLTSHAINQLCPNRPAHNKASLSPGTSEGACTSSKSQF